MIKICVDSLKENSVHLFFASRPREVRIFTHGNRYVWVVTFSCCANNIESSNCNIENKIVIDDRDSYLLQGLKACQFKIIVRTRT